jgi:hypothetical protein
LRDGGLALPRGRLLLLRRLRLPRGLLRESVDGDERERDEF